METELIKETTLSVGTTLNSSNSGSYIIFVVEDSEICRMLLDRFLTKMANSNLSQKPNCVVHSFASGEECVKHLSEKPDIVVLDYFLNEKNPDAMNGLELLKEIKKHSPQTEVLVLSEQENVLVTAEFFNQGASQYISKEPQGENRIQNAVLDTIHKIDKKRILQRNKIIIVVVLLLAGIVIGAILL